jgi:hypothetical protein
MDMGIPGYWAIIPGLLYAALGWAIYRASKTLTLAGVIIHTVGTVAGVIFGLIINGKPSLGWADCITTGMLIQGARGVVRYRGMIAVSAKPPTPTGDSDEHREVPPGSMVESSKTIENKFLPRRGKVFRHRSLASLSSARTAAGCENLIACSVLSVDTIFYRTAAN